MTIEEGYRDLVTSLKGRYDSREAETIAGMVLEKLTGLTSTQRIMHRRNLLSTTQEREWMKMRKLLLQSIPVQQVLQEAWFFGLSFYVDSSVLIPRPETEELVREVLDLSNGKGEKRILDVGTGSGCIPIALKVTHPDLEVWAMEKYEKALLVAKKNATLLAADIHFEQQDVFDTTGMDAWPDFDVIVSNPPYILQSERKGMARHVVEYEPAQALFVPDDDGLMFYKQILKVAQKKLQIGGYVVVEVNETMGETTRMLFEEQLSGVTLKKDFYGKDRLLVGQNL